MIVKPKVLCWKTLAEIEKEHGMQEAPYDDLHQDALIQEIVKHKYIICGDTHQNLCIPVFNDGYSLLSMRKWAELMDDAFLYISPLHHRENWFYMVSTCGIKENLPCYL